MALLTQAFPDVRDLMTLFRVCRDDWRVDINPRNNEKLARQIEEALYIVERFAEEVMKPLAAA